MRKPEDTKDHAERVTQKILALFGAETLAEMGRRSKWLLRRRKLTPMAWVSAIVVTLSGARVQWLSDIWRSVQAISGTTVHYKPFHKQLCRPGFADFFRELLERALQHFTGPVLAPCEKNLRRFRDIVIHDGSSFALKGSLARSWPGRFTTISPSAVELHVTMSLLEDNPSTLVLTADSESERAYRPTALDLKDRLFLGDRGYQDRRFFADTQAAGGFFIVRGTKAIRPTITSAIGDVSRRTSRSLVGQRLSWELLPKEDLDLDVDWTLSNGELYRGRIVVFYRKDKRNRDRFVYLQTNLSRAEFSAESVSDLYRLRWQVELFFKECKSHANLHAFDTGKEEITEGLIWASL
jgi:hypothetical protein